MSDAVFHKMFVELRRYTNYPISQVGKRRHREGKQFSDGAEPKSVHLRRSPSGKAGNPGEMSRPQDSPVMEGQPRLESRSLLGGKQDANQLHHGPPRGVAVPGQPSVLAQKSSSTILRPRCLSGATSPQASRMVT